VEFLSVCKAMLETNLLPDFITVDGGEGGTGAAPQEFSDSVGVPLVDGLVFVHNALVGCGLRDKIRIACSGKAITAADIVRNCAIGADWCNAARAFMMAVGCIQAQQCHTNECPVGVATQRPDLFRALHVGDKAERVNHFHYNTMESLSELVAAMGLDRADQLRPYHVSKRIGPNQILSYEEAYNFVGKGALLNGHCGMPVLDKNWAMASADSFRASVLR
jgi:glutamate synthase domain-containing protein 2